MPSDDDDDDIYMDETSKQGQKVQRHNLHLRDVTVEAMTSWAARWGRIDLSSVICHTYIK